MNAQSFTAAWASLSPRQSQVMEGIARGLTPEEIADKLGIAKATVAIHRRFAMVKFKKHNGESSLRVPLFIAFWWEHVGPADASKVA